MPPVGLVPIQLCSDTTILASASRTANPTIATQANYSGRGVVLMINVSANAGGSGSITVTIQGVDPISGNTYTILASSAITAVALATLKVHPMLTAVGNSVANDVLPRTWTVSVVHNNSNPITYSINASIIG